MPFSLKLKCNTPAQPRMIHWVLNHIVWGCPWTCSTLELGEDVKPLCLLGRGGQGEINRKGTKGNQPLNSCQKPQGIGWLMLWKSSLPIRGYSKDQDRFKRPKIRGEFIFSYWGSRFVLVESSENYLFLLFLYYFPFSWKMGPFWTAATHCSRMEQYERTTSLLPFHRDHNRRQQGLWGHLSCSGREDYILGTQSPCSSHS